MSIKSFFDKDKLKVFFNYSQKGNIWRMHFTNNDLIVCETRDLEKKEVYFFSVNYKTNEIFLKNFQIKEKWWVSIANVNSDLMFLNYFRKPDLPEHLGFTAIDIKTGEEKWTEPKLVFLFASNNEVYAFKQLFENKVYYKFDPQVGKIIKEFKEEPDILTVLQLKSDSEKLFYSNFIYAEIYGDDSSTQEHAVNSYLKDRIKGLKISGSLEMIKYHDHLIYNYHQDKGIDMKNINLRTLSNILEIYDMTKNKIVYQDILNSTTSNYVPDSFFIKDKMLFYIKEKKNLLTLKLD
jgi:hypothetical protein